VIAFTAATAMLGGVGRIAHSILLVDDDDELRDILTESLHQRGYAVFEARDGREALRVLDALTPHAIVLDLMMPAMDGFEFLAARAARAELGAIPVVIASGASPHDNLAASPWNEFLAKPYEVEALVDAIERLCRVNGSS